VFQRCGETTLETGGFEPPVCHWNIDLKSVDTQTIEQWKQDVMKLCCHLVA